MKKKQVMQKTRDNNGSALVIAVIILVVATMVLGAVTIRVLNQDKHVTQYEEYKNSFVGVLTGVEEAKFRVEMLSDSTLPGVLISGDLNDSYTPQIQDGQLVPIRIGDEGLTPQALSTTPNIRYVAYASNWAHDNIDNDADGITDMPNDVSEENFYTVYASAGIFEGEQGFTTLRQLEVVSGATDVNVWNNAIFADTGQDGNIINGNVSIHGSVHLLGNPDDAGLVALQALDLSGTSLIHNNYNGLEAFDDPDLESRVPLIDRTLEGGVEVETLNSVLRVRNGLVGLSGNSEIGEPVDLTDEAKNTMDAIYATDGWTGNGLDANGDPINAYSDNGWDEHYDLGNRVPFPWLSDPYKDSWHPNGVTSPDGDLYAHDEYFEDILSNSNPCPGPITIDSGQNSTHHGDIFYYNATTGTVATTVADILADLATVGIGSLEELQAITDDPNADDDPGDGSGQLDFVYFDAPNDTMYMNGQIVIDGDFAIEGANDVTYHGRASFLANGDVTLDTNLVSPEPTLDAAGEPIPTFPVDNIIGIMARQDMVVGASAQLSLMGAFYAQGQISSIRQTTVMGTYVARSFDMGTNVPNIFQVPSLASNLPYGMIGDWQILILDEISWRELGVN